MNKRVKNKIIKRNNTKKHEAILKEISKKFTVKTKNFLDGYFIFNMGKNSVCHFTLEETPNWMYGIWLDKKGYQIFGEHEDLIDKFKPSRGYLSYFNCIKDFIIEVENIKNNPKKYLVDSLTYGDVLNYHYDNCNEFIEKEYNEFMANKLQEEEDKDFDREYAFKLFKELPDIFGDIIAVGVIDSNKGSWIIDPRYTIHLVINKNKNLTTDEIEALFVEVDNYIEEKNYSKERKTYDHRFSLHGFYDKLSDIKCCDYKYYKK